MRRKMGSFFGMTQTSLSGESSQSNTLRTVLEDTNLKSLPCATALIKTRPTCALYMYAKYSTVQIRRFITASTILILLLVTVSLTLYRFYRFLDLISPWQSYRHGPKAVQILITMTLRVIRRANEWDCFWRSPCSSFTV